MQPILSLLKHLWLFFRVSIPARYFTLTGCAIPVRAPTLPVPSWTAPTSPRSVPTSWAGPTDSPLTTATTACTGPMPSLTGQPAVMRWCFCFHVIWMYCYEGVKSPYQNQLFFPLFPADSSLVFCFGHQQPPRNTSSEWSVYHQCKWKKKICVNPKINFFVCFLNEFDTFGFARFFERHT